MEVIYLLIPIALGFAGLIVVLFVWAVRSGQYDNLDAEAYRILFDDDQKPPHQKSSHQKSTSPEQEP